MTDELDACSTCKQNQVITDVTSSNARGFHDLK